MVSWFQRGWETIRGVANVLSVLKWVVAAIGVVWFTVERAWDSFPLVLTALLSLLAVVWIVEGIVRLYDRFASKRRKEPKPRENPSLESVRKLLGEAAEGIVAAQLEDPMSSSFASYYWSIFTFLESAFSEPRDQAMKDRVRSRRKRLADGSYNDATVIAESLRLLAKKTTVDDLDPGFLLPLTFEQFEGHDGEWPKNVSPGV